MFDRSYYYYYCVLIDFLKPELEVGILQMTVITAGTDTLPDATC